MGKILSVFIAFGIMGASTIAFAGDKIYTATGTVKSVDLMSHVVTLENGSTYKIARGVNIKRMKAGERVTLTYSGFGGIIEASAITPAID